MLLRSNLLCLEIKRFIYRIKLKRRLSDSSLRSNVQHHQPALSSRLLLLMDSSISLMGLQRPLVSSAAALCYSALAVVLTYFFYICIYNFFFHPLAEFPGPWLCAMSEWFLVLFIRAVPTYGLELHKRYGELSLSPVALKT